MLFCAMILSSVAVKAQRHVPFPRSLEVTQHAKLTTGTSPLSGGSGDASALGADIPGVGVKGDRHWRGKANPLKKPTWSIGAHPSNPVWVAVENGSTVGAVIRPTIGRLTSSGIGRTTLPPELQSYADSEDAKSQSRWVIGAHVARLPAFARTSGQVVTLGSEADESPVPSEVHYPSADVSGLLGVGLTYRKEQAPEAGEVTIEPIFRGEIAGPRVVDATSISLNLFTGGGGGMIRLGFSEAHSFSIGGVATLGYVFGEVGEVGAAEGDVYLDAPDGNRYQTGAAIRASSASLGIDGLAALEIYRFRLTGGYRLLTQPTEWRYAVENGERSSELPAEGFRANPPSYRLSGIYVSLAYTVPL